MSLLSGIPEAEWKRSLLMPVQVFTDESGSSGEGRFMVMAALVAQAEEWASFSTAWQDSLDAPSRIAYFSGREAFGLKGEFYSWSRERRDRKVLDLLSVLNQFSPLVIHCGIEVAPFKELVAPRCVKPVSHPYFWLFYQVVVAACSALRSVGRSEQFEAIFDEQRKLGPLVRRWYPLVLEGLPPEERAMMPVDPAFRSDKVSQPLQAADLLAYVFRVAVDAAAGKDYVEFVERLLPQVAISDQTTILRRDKLEYIASQITPERMTPAMLKRRRDLIGY
jgi:hypothetical protein